MTTARRRGDDNTCAAFERFSVAHDRAPWPRDAVQADAELADYLHLKLEEGIGHSRLKCIARAARQKRHDLGLEVDDRQAKELLAAVYKNRGPKTERVKIAALTRTDLQTCVVGALLASSLPSLAAVRTALAIELGHEHQLRIEDITRRHCELGEASITIDGREYRVATDLTPLRERGGPTFGTPSALRQSIESLNSRVGFTVGVETHIAHGLTDAQAEWARFAANPRSIDALMWIALVLVGNAWALRNDDIQRIQLDSISEHPDGVGFVRYGAKQVDDPVPIRREIAHDHTEGRLCGACYVWMWAAWRREAEGVTTGPLFVSRFGPKSGRDKPITANATAAALKRAVRASPLAAARIGSRSIRIGTATELAREGFSLAEIQEVTGHKSVGELLRYIRSLSPRFQPHLDV